MTNPAVVPTSDGTHDPDASFVADFERLTHGFDSSLSDDSERSSEPTPDAVEPESTDAPPDESEAETPGDPEAPPKDAEAIEAPKYEPLTYTVNGQSKLADWALKVGDEGVVIQPENIAKLQDLIQRDEWQSQQNRDLYQKTQQYEALAHKVGDAEYHGVEAFRQLQAERAALDASGGKVMSALADPEFVTNLALAYQSGDQNQVQAVLAGVIQQVKFAGEKAQFDAIRAASQQEASGQSQQATAQAQTIEYQQIISEFGKALPVLTADDLRAMHDHFSAFRDRIFRPATLEEARSLNLRPGTIIKDPTVMYDWAKERAALRQQFTDATKAAESAAKENAARQATRPAPKGKKAPAPAPKPTSASKDKRFEGDDGSFAAWKKRLEAGRWAHDEVAPDN